MLEPGEFVKDVDRYCILLVGKPSFVGTTYWCEQHVQALKKNIETLEKPVDVISIIWKTDATWSGNGRTMMSGFFPLQDMDERNGMDEFSEQMYGIQVDAETFTGKIKVKSSLEKYLRDQFDFADTFTTYYVDYFDIVKRLRKEYNDESLYNPGWQIQYYQLTEAYRLNPDIFDRYTKDSFILKIRYDNVFSVGGIRCLLEHYAGKLNEYKFKLHPSELDIASRCPNILLEKGEDKSEDKWANSANMSIIAGKQFWMSDMMVGFDGEGIKTLVKDYEQWTKQEKNGYNRNFVKNERDANMQKPNDKINFTIGEFTAHRHLTEFLFDYNYNIHFTHHASQNIARTYEAHNNGLYDSSRQQWYNYTKDQVQKLHYYYRGQKRMTPNSHMNPVYSIDECNSVKEYINSGGWIMEHTKTREMEQMICDYTGAKHAHMVPSATMGLLLASMLADVKKDEHFNCPAYTQAATANGAILMGGIPNFCDVEPEAYTIDWEHVTQRVVFVTSINGRTPDSYGEDIKRHRDAGHFVIEDAAQALGSRHKDWHVGTFGDVGVFSFGAPKIITTGQGGCIITNSEEISERIHAIKNFGRTVGVGETYNVMGMNFKFTDLQASFGIAQMRRLPEVVKRKKQIYQRYVNNLTGHVEFINTDLTTVTPTYPEIIVSRRDELAEHLRKQQIGCRAVYDSLSNQPYHSQWATPTPVTDKVAKTGLQLPAQADLSNYDIDEICNVILDFYKL